MTVKKALVLLNYYSEKKEEMKKNLLDRNKSWNHGEINLFSLSETMADNIDADLIFLREIKKHIEPICKHPKKSQDVVKLPCGIRTHDLFLSRELFYPN